LDQPWELWQEIAVRCFVNGTYDPQAEIEAHRDLTGASVANSYLVLNNKYILTLLTARPEELQTTVSNSLLCWVWNLPQGIGYLGKTPALPPTSGAPADVERWFATQELLARFPGWSDLAGGVVDWLWSQQTADGYWDFGYRRARSDYFPLSANWRKPIHRRFDWSARVLALLAKYES
jgi:hypothetical protein